MKKTIQMAVAGALLSIAAFANAASVSQSSSPILDITNASSASSLNFSAFNGSLGHLDSVVFTVTSTISGWSGAANLATYADTSTVGAGADLELTVAGLSSPLNLSTLFYQSFSLAANPSGDLDYDAFLNGDDLGYAKSASFSGKVVSASSAVSDLSVFTSPSGVSLLFAGSYAGSGSGNAAYAAIPVVDAVVSLTYNYTPAPVPEPETYGMLLAGLGLVGAIARRKAKKAA
ncbi:choice-of-anchor E domain-containing protein [Oxalobacteraceae bacterium A2-2]